MLLDELVNSREKRGLRRPSSFQELDKFFDRVLFLRREFADEIGKVLCGHASSYQADPHNPHQRLE
jgi:hypothetical protein